MNIPNTVFSPVCKALRWGSLIFTTVALSISALAATLSGPILPNTPVISVTTFEEFAEVGYQQAEFFISGTANAYTTNAPLTPDGIWNGISASGVTAPYTTRMLVYRPVAPADFNGTVYVEWFNVSGGEDTGPEWAQTHTQIVREGAIYIGVSVQFTGVQALKSLVDQNARYTLLLHPGDSFSYDIYAQAGQAIWDNSATLLGAGFTPERLLAMGESQSAHGLTTYINAIHPLLEIYDGFLVHSRLVPEGLRLSQGAQSNILVPATSIRNDISAPVIMFQTETDVAFTRLLTRQPDTSKFRLWEVAGTAHFDYYGLVGATFDIGDGEAEALALETLQNPTSTPIPGFFECRLPINSGPMHYVMNAAVYWLNRWVQEGTQPPSAPLLEVTTAIGMPVVFSLDQHGNVLGGVRTPFVDVPIATVGNGANASAGPGAPPLSGFCFLFGVTEAFSTEKISTLYKNHGKFSAKWNQSTQQAFKAGFIIEADANALKSAAAQSDIGKQPK